MHTLNTPFQITKPANREPISGIVTTALAMGALVMLKNTGTQDTNELVAATGGVRPAILEQDVLSDADWQDQMLKEQAFNPNVRMPVPVGSGVSARFAEFAEYEGATYFDAIDGTSAVETALTTAGGKFKAAAEGDEIVAYLNRKRTPDDSTSFRWEIRFV
jgi:hypothetical protein